MISVPDVDLITERVRDIRVAISVGWALPTLRRTAITGIEPSLQLTTDN